MSPIPNHIHGPVEFALLIRYTYLWLRLDETWMGFVFLTKVWLLGKARGRYDSPRNSTWNLIWGRKAGTKRGIASGSGPCGDWWRQNLQSGDWGTVWGWINTFISLFPYKFNILISSDNLHFCMVDGLKLCHLHIFSSVGQSDLLQLHEPRHLQNGLQTCPFPISSCAYHSSRFLQGRHWLSTEECASHVGQAGNCSWEIRP